MEKTKNIIEKEMTSNLKKFLKDRGHYASGKLYKSIRVNIDQNMQIKINAYEYLVYLEDGGFIKDFFNLPSTKQSIVDLGVIAANDALAS